MKRSGGSPKNGSCKRWSSSKDRAPSLRKASEIQRRLSSVSANRGCIGEPRKSLQRQRLCPPLSVDPADFERRRIDDPPQTIAQRFSPLLKCRSDDSFQELRICDGRRV